MITNDIITFSFSNGEETDFYEVFRTAIGNDIYSVLKPVGYAPNFEENEVLVCRVGIAPRGMDNYEIERDEFIIDAVVREYDESLEKSK